MKKKLRKRPIKSIAEKERMDMEDRGLRLAWITFIDEYIKNGGNGTKAYMVAYPDSSERSAKDNASRLIAKDSVRAEINNKLVSQTCTEEFITGSLVDIATRYRGEKTIMAAVKCLEILSKIKGMLVDTKKIYFNGENPAVFPALVKKENKDKWDKETDRISE